MPNVKSAEKRVRTNRRRMLRNRAVRSELRTAIRRVKEAIQQGDLEQAQLKTNLAVSVIGQTARKGVIHKNKAARLQSRLRRRTNKALAAKSE